MKFTIQTEALTNALTRVANIPGGRGGSPFSVGVKLEAGMLGLQLSRITAEANMTLTLDTLIDEEGSAILDHREITSLLSRVASKEIVIETELKANGHEQMKFTFGRGKASLAVFLPEFGIEPPEEDQLQDMFAMESKVFVAALDFAGKATSFEAAQMHLNGVRLQPLAKRFSILGTDGKRLHAQFFDDIDCSAACTVPNEAVAAVQSAMRGESGQCEVRIGEGSITIQTPSLLMRTQLLSEGFPKIDPLAAITPADLHGATVNKEEILEAFKTAMPLAEGEAKFLDLAIEKSGAVISAANSTSDITLPISASSKHSLQCRVAAQQLSAAMGHIDDDDGNIDFGIHPLYKSIFIIRPDRLAMVALARSDQDKF